MMKFNLIHLFILLIMFFILYILLTNLIHPIFLILLIMIFTILTCTIISMKNSNYLYSIMMFFILISGLLIIFLYFASLSSNEPSNIQTPPTYMNSNMFLNLLLMIFIILLTPKYFPYIYSEINSLIFITENSFMNIKKIYTNPNINLTLMCMFFLFLSLLMVIKICSLKSSSLRKLN
uniref:NADH dehydrogenase subunit 6 n=1 Tax=Cardiocondyla obscurior TaxID=286306 RepID=A0A343AXT8_9HYME|nr:NADH dehydrogenase subunit 6 [Cardiocondyla obscurior]